MPDVKSPVTYGEYYWATQVEAEKVHDEALEDAVRPYIPSLFSDPEIREAMPFDILPKLESVLAMEAQGLAAIGGRFVSEVADQAVSMVMTPALRKTQYAANRLFHNLILLPDQATALFRRKRLLPEYFNYCMEAAGFDDANSNFAYQASQPFPSITELMRWARYHGVPDNTWATLTDVVDMDPVDWPRWDWLAHQQLTTDQINNLYKRGRIDVADIGTKLQEVGWYPKDIADIQDLAFPIPNAMLLIQGSLHAGASLTEIGDDLTAADIHPAYQQRYYDAVLTKPDSNDLVAYHLRRENNLAELPTDLKRIGIHPDYLDIYRTLAARIPPVADIISMAVREAFSPGVAQRFGQYEDFPDDLERFAQQQGLSPEWSKRYWAAHWGLPSPQQGFEMLHRGVIDRNDLGLLMRAQDIMPFWRDKMTEIAYRPLTRVDVRRMYKEGILDERDVFRAYLDAGYSDENAENMTEFTLAYVLSQQMKFTSGDVVKAYTERMISNSEANSLLRMLNVRSGAAGEILSAADYKRAWALKDQQTNAIRNLYRKGEYDESAARTELFRLDYPTEQVEALMQQWWYEAKEDVPPTWTKAETLKFIKNGVITKERGETELRRMRYDPEHIAAYMAGVTSKPPTT